MRRHPPSRYQVVTFRKRELITGTRTRVQADTRALEHACHTNESAEVWKCLRGIRQTQLNVVHPPGTTLGVVLIGCSSMKLDRRAPARELYTSPIFRKTLELALCFTPPERVFVTSAKHGLLALDQEVDPYDETVSTKLGMRMQWAQDVLIALERRMSYRFDPARRPPPIDVPALRGLHVMLMMGERYGRPIQEQAPTGWKFSTPLAGLEIGERLRWLNRALAQQARVAKRKGRAR